jgi:hypothetical protein
LSDKETHIENAPCNRPLKQKYRMQYQDLKVEQCY